MIEYIKDLVLGILQRREFKPTFKIGRNVVGHWELFYTGAKPTTMEQAWEITIAKWQALVAATAVSDDEYDVVENGGGDTCGLCMWMSASVLVRRNAMRRCYSCPVRLDTGKEYCRNTSYLKYYVAVDLGSRRRANEAATEELAYLQALYAKWQKEGGK